MTINRQPTTDNRQLVPHNKSAGFTLVEALIAISILLIAVVEPLSLTSKSVFNANVGKDQITASYLAQEGMEFIRNKRDVNALTGLSSSTGLNWLTGLSKCIDESASGGTDIDGDVCTFDALNDPNLSNSYLSCNDIDCGNEPIRIIPISGNLKRFGYDGISPTTSFRRSVTMTEIVPGREVEVSVKVIWKTVYLDRNFTIKERLFNWGY